MSQGQETDTPAALGPMDIRGILAALPHRYPMLLIDRVVSMVPRTSIHAVKAVSFNESFFQGHFPGRPIMPGVRSVEALGLRGAGKLVYFMGIEGAKFRAPIEPGCLIDFHVEFTQLRGAICKFSGKAMVNGKLAAEAHCTAMIADPPKD
jgi:3-hydroxyacyl-[acyl-carrier-protein] dehydratase